MTQETESVSRLSQLADELRMFASQIDENAADPANQLPTPSRLDDWLNDFRTAYWCVEISATIARIEEPNRE